MNKEATVQERCYMDGGSLIHRLVWRRAPRFGPVKKELEDLCELTTNLGFQDGKDSWIFFLLIHLMVS